MPTLEPDYLDPVLALPLASDVNLGHLFKLLRPQLFISKLGA